MKGETLGGCTRLPFATGFGAVVAVPVVAGVLCGCVDTVAAGSMLLPITAGLPVRPRRLDEPPNVGTVDGTGSGGPAVVAVLVVPVRLLGISEVAVSAVGELDMFELPSSPTTTLGNDGLLKLISRLMPLRLLWDETMVRVKFSMLAPESAAAAAEASVALGAAGVVGAVLEDCVVAPCAPNGVAGVTICEGPESPSIDEEEVIAPGRVEILVPDTLL